MMELTGSTLSVFIGLTIVVFGFAAFMTGQAIASTWRPLWQALPYAFLLACADRFFTYALFDGVLLSLSGLVIDFVILVAISFVAFRLTRVRQMVRQYPWLVEQISPFSWRERG